MGPKVSYILPLRARRPVSSEFVAYVTSIARFESIAEVIVVDRSGRDVFEDFETRRSRDVRHVQVDADLECLANGKVAGVLTGVRLASQEHLILADEDVRYDEHSVLEIRRRLEQHDLVAPQNYFDPLPWHACLDSARTLVNRATGGDWPGTFGVRRSAIVRLGGYDGDVLFENLELVRTLESAGGRTVSAPDLFVRRLPPSADHFWSQRIRQAYDEFARPARLVVWLSILPAAVALSMNVGVWTIGLIGAVSMLVAAAGRAIGGGRRVFPLSTVVAAPWWILERAVCAWLAVGSRLFLGGVPYGGRILSRAGTPARVLRRRYAALRGTGGADRSGPVSGTIRHPL